MAYVPADRALPAVRSGEARAFALCALVLAALLLVPLLAVQYPAMPDYVNHMARAHVIVQAELHGREHPFYELRHVLIPNLALDVLVPLMVRAGITLDHAMRAFTGLALLLPLAGCVALAAAWQRRVPWLALLAFPLAYNRYFAWGFLNYFFSVGLALLAFAAWLALRQRTRALPLAVLAPLLAVAGGLIMLSHLVGFGILALLVVSSEAWRAWGERRVLPLWRSRGLQAAALGLFACVVFYLSAFERNLSLEALWPRWFLARVRSSASPFISYRTLPGLLVAAVVLGTLCALVLRGHVHGLVRAARAPVLVLLVAFIALPSVLMGSYFLAERLSGVVWSLLFAGLVLDRGLPGRARLLIVLAAFAATGLKSAEITTEWRRGSAKMAVIRAALAQVPERSLIVTRIFGDREAGGNYPLRHSAAFAVMDRDAYIPNFFGFPFNGETVGFREAMQPLTRSDLGLAIIDPDDPLDWTAVCANFDILFAMRERPAKGQEPRCVTPLVQGQDFTVYRIVKGGEAEASTARPATP